MLTSSLCPSLLPLACIGFALQAISCVPTSPLSDYNSGSGSTGGSAGASGGSSDAGAGSNAGGSDNFVDAGEGEAGNAASLGDSGSPVDSGVTTDAAPVPLDASPCSGENDFSVGASCYVLLSPATTWVAGQAACEQWGGALVTFNSEEEETAVVTEIDADAAEVVEFWIGYNDIEVEGTFEWASGQTSTYVGWDVALAQPTPNALDEDCAARRQGGWYDIDCDNAADYRSVCERPL